MLSFLYRFHGHGSLRYVYKNGQTVRSRLLTVKYTVNPHRKHSRFAVVVSKKVHKGAVGRNRIRRRIYEILRQEIPHMAKPHDIAIIVVSSEVLHMPAEELGATVTQLLQQANIYK
ncbi:MAG TPA: ribonuclease P protein component [Candidatus Saccharimonadales bacterium]|nr:ribonuclease P protein component [Candidatus Saccharimonadales bacterium]